MTVLNVTNATLKGTVKGPTFNGNVDGSTFSGSVTYTDTTTPPIEPPIEPPVSGSATITHLRTVSATQSRMNVANGATSNSNNHNVFGTAPSGASVTLMRGTTTVKTVQAGTDGNWSCATGILPDGLQSFTAKVGNDVSTKFDVTITSNIAGFTNVPDVNFTIGSMPVYAGHHPGRSYSTAQPDSHTLRFECRQGDRWQWDSSGSGRTEIGTGNGYDQSYYIPNGGAWYLTAEVMWEAGAANDASGFFINFQMHNDDGPKGSNQGTSPYVVFGLSGTAHSQTPGDHFYVQCRDWNSKYGGSIQNSAKVHDVYIAPANIERGKWHTIELDVVQNNGSGGHVHAWFDGVALPKYDGPVGYGYMGYPEFGVYRSNAPSTQSIKYRNYILIA